MMLTVSARFFELFSDSYNDMRRLDQRGDLFAGDESELLLTCACNDRDKFLSAVKRDNDLAVDRTGLDFLYLAAELVAG